MDLDPLEDPDPELDSNPRWIRIHMISIPTLLGAIPDPDPDPAKTEFRNTSIIYHFPDFVRREKSFEENQNLSVVTSFQRAKDSIFAS